MIDFKGILQIKTVIDPLLFYFSYNVYKMV